MPSWPTTATRNAHSALSSKVAPTTVGTEAVNGLIELRRRVARGFLNRDNYRLRMLLIAGGLTAA